MGLRNFFETLFGLNTEVPPQAPDMQRWQAALAEGTQARHAGRDAEALEIYERVLAEVRQADNPVAEATVLGHIGALHTEQRRWDDAAQVLQQSIDIAEGQDNPMLTAAVLNDWGNYLLAKGEDQQALETFTEALDAARDGEEPELTAHVLDRLAACYMAQNNAAYARRLLEEANQKTRFQNPAFVGRLGVAAIATGNEADGHRWVVQALRLSHAMGNVDEEVHWASTLAARYTESGKLFEADRLYQRAAMLLGRGASIDAKDRVHFLLGRADVSHQIGRDEDAIQHIEEAIPLAEDLGMMTDVARAHGLLGSAYRVMGRHDRAVGHLQTALGYLPGDADSVETVALRLELGMVQQEVDPAAAEATYRQAVESAQQAGSRGHVAQALLHLGRLAHQQGDYAAALTAWKDAAQRFEDDGDHRHLAPLLCDIANVYKEQGDRKQALTLYEQALVALNNVDHPATRGIVLSNVANMYTETGDAETAQAFYEEAVAIARDLGDRSAESLRLGNLGWFHLVTGRTTEAVQALESAITITQEEQGESLMLAVQQDNLAQAYAAQGDFMRALVLHLAAREVADKLEDSHWQAAFHSNTGRTLALQGDAEKAREHYDTALHLSRMDDDDLLTARTLWRLGDLLRVEGDPGAAESYAEAVQLARQLGAQRDLAHARLGQGLLAADAGESEAARDSLEEARRLFTILHAPEVREAAAALNRMD